MRKEILLTSIVILEVTAGGIGLFTFYRQTKQKQVSAQIQTATKINKDNIVFPEVGNRVLLGVKT